MRTFMKRYGYAVMSVSMILLYFVITGGVTATVVNSPEFWIQQQANPKTLTVGQQGKFYLGIRDGNDRDKKTKTVCNPPEYTEEVIQTFTPRYPEFDYCTKDNSPGIPQTGWIKGPLVPDNPAANYVYYHCNLTLSFNTPGLKTVYFRSKAYREAGESVWSYDSMKVTVTGTAPLPLKRYTFSWMSVEYYNANGDPKGPTQTFTFTDPANQYFELKGDDKIDFVFKWKPSAADLQKVPDLEINYDIRDLNKTYQVLKKEAADQFSWAYKIKYDQTRTVEFNFGDEGTAHLHTKKPAKEGNGVTVAIFMVFAK